jgi:hypothetical protein
MANDACLRCGAANRPGRRFCAECGAPLPASCPECGFVNDAAEKFCGGCGVSLAAPHRRQRGRSAGPTATPAGDGLFADLVRYTQPPVHSTPRTCMRCSGLFQIIDEIIGVSARWTHIGDAVMAVFRAPIAATKFNARF